MTFIDRRGNLCSILINSLTVFVQFGDSVFARKSVDQHRKHHYRSFIDGCPNGFISNPAQGMIFEFYPGGMYHRGDLCHCKRTLTQKNHFHSDEGGVKMIFLSFKKFPHSRKIENFNFLVFNGLHRVISTWITCKNTQIRLKMYSITCFHTYEVCDHQKSS